MKTNTIYTKYLFAFVLFFLASNGNLWAQSGCLNDTQAPTILCAAPVTINTTPGLCTGTTALTTPTVSDNCTSLGNALDFDGTNDHITMGDVNAVDGISKITIEAWVYRTNTSGFNSIVNKSVNQLTSAFQLFLFSPNDVFFRVATTNDTYGYTTGNQIPINSWVHIAAVFDGTAIGNANRVKIYINGVQKTLTFVGTIPNITPNTIAPLQIAFPSPGGASYWKGKIDEVRIWTTARTSAQILSNFNSALNAQAGLLALYHFNQGVANGNNAGTTSVIDDSGNGLNGTLTNSALTGSTSNWTTGPTIPIAISNNAPATYPKGTTTITWTATDASGNTATCTQVVTVVSPEINVQGNAIDIADGDVTPSTSDHTDFESVNVGSNLVRTYTIKNTGTSSLTVSSITKTGGDAAMFTIGALTPASPIPSLGSATFTVTFTPASAGLKTATVSINNDDCDEAVYDFALQGAGIQDCQVSAWSEWSAWSSEACGVTATRTRTRTVITPAAYGGSTCPILEETETITNAPCPVDCQVSAWSTWSAWSTEACGVEATRTRTRTVITAAAYGGTCPVLEETETLTNAPCPVDCQVSAWSAWSAWSTEACGVEATRTRTRTVITAAAYGGACPVLEETETTTNTPCPVDCVVSDWSAWSAWSTEACGVEAARTRTRTVTTAAAYGGVACSVLEETESRTNAPCPVDCVVSAWSAWSAWSTEACGTEATRTRTRTVITPAANDGASCGPLTETETRQNAACITCPVVDASSSSNPVALGTTATLKATISPVSANVTVNFKVDNGNGGIYYYSGVTNTSGVATATVSGLAVEVYKVTATINGSNCASSDAAYLPIYDPNGGFVTGGGWINSPAGAMTANASATGKANFGFNAKYKKGSSAVDGNTEFQFSAGGLNFNSSLHEAGSLVVTTTNGKATYRGDGTINGVPGYKFTLTAFDGNWLSSTTPDRFRIKIWGAGGVVYDNQMSQADNADDATVLGGGSIVLHQVGKKAATRVKAPITVNELDVKVLTAENTKNSVGQVYPNPSNGEAKMNINTTESGNWTIKTFDITGKLINKDNFILQKGKNDIELKKLNTGMNYIQVSDGKITEVRKVLIK